LFVFLGHVENYAWVTALLLVYFLLVKRHLENGWPMWPALIALILAASFHMLAVFYTPTFLFLLRERDPETRQWRWRPDRSEGEVLLTILIVWALLLSTAQMSFEVDGLDNGLSRLVPLTMPKPPNLEGKYALFTLFSFDHLKMWLHFHWMSSPLGLVLLILLARTIRTRFETFLLVGVGCAFLWTWMWHPDRAQRDWDLFANLALPMNVLVGLLLVKMEHRLRAAWIGRRHREVERG
jgi:hypothetical protein